MFRLIEQILRPTALPPDHPPPPVDSSHALIRFYWHFVNQTPLLVAALFAAGLTVALLDTSIPVFIGHIVALVSAKRPGILFRDAGWQLLGMPRS